MQQTPLPTHGFTPPHSDTLMSHMLYSNTFVLTAFFLGHTVSYLSRTPNPSYTIFRFLFFFLKYRTSKLSWDAHLQIFLAALHVLTLDIGKLMTTPTTSLCQQCSNQARVWHQQNCPDAFSSNGCHPIGDHSTEACNGRGGDEWWEGRRAEEFRI